MKYLPLLLVILLTGCGTLPEPFYGDPGVEGAKLAVPPAPVLIVPPPIFQVPKDPALEVEPGKIYENYLTAALVNLDVPTVARTSYKGDWRLAMVVGRNGSDVTLQYSVIGPDGNFYGGMTSTPILLADWDSGTPDALNKVANGDALRLTKLLAQVNAQVQQSNPRSLENRPPVVFFSGVTGAPGDGDNALALNMNRDLPGLGVQQASSPAQADYTIKGVVKTKPDAGGQILVEIDWLVHDSNNRMIGQVTQLHDLNPGDIVPYWGDVAAAAAAEGASGIHTVIVNNTLHKKTS